MKTPLNHMNSTARPLAILFFILILVLCWNNPALSQTATQGVWSDIAEVSIADRSDRVIVPERYRILVLDKDLLHTILNQTPAEGSSESKTTAVTLALPLPDGTVGNFRIMESPIMAPELAAKYPEMRTFVGQGIDDPTATVRFDWTQFGFHAMILSANGTVYVDPYSRRTTSYYISYFKRDLQRDESRIMQEVGPFGTDSEIAAEIRRLVAQGVKRTIGEELRTYRLALAATGEYTIYHGGTVPAGMAAIVTAMNRVNGVYEREVAIRMVLIPNNDTLVYTNPSTDPYTNNNGSTMLGQNQTNLDNVIGNANYDVGHVFSTGGGGVAFVGVPCRTGFKARGVTGLPAPIGDPFYIDYVAHEMGHQFGANHSFNGNAGSCAGNGNPATAYEPGSGSTIMAYAGICSPQNIQNASDDYFHGVSIDEIVAYTQLGAGSSCPVVTLTGNDPPSVDAGSAVVYTIPINTPFVLTGSGTDPNNDTLTYTWEEFDLGPAGHPNSPVGDAPIFRSFKGTRSPARTFPRLSDILNNTQTMGEILPSYSRILNFRLTGRDNRAGGGGIGHDVTSVVVTNAAGPFQITYPNAAIAWVTNSTDSVKWNVANTAGPPINCASVNILLSTDGGQTFPVTLASNTPNDGTEVVTVPGPSTGAARVKVESVGNVFFDICNVNFLITPLTAPVLAYPANGSLDQPTSLTVGWNSVPLATTYHVQVSRNPGFVINVVVNDSTVTDTSRAVTGLLTGAIHYWRVRAKNADGRSLWSSVWNFTTIALPAPVTLQAPPHQASIAADSVVFLWNGQTSADRYWLEYATDSTFAVSTIDSNLTDTTKVVHQLQVNQTYWWRAKAHNSLGWGPLSVVRNFTLISTSVRHAESVPHELVLEQNYPNPFNPTTEIRFSIPSSAGSTQETFLRIYDVLGREIATLVHEVKQPGSYAVTWDASGLPTGVYLYRLLTGDQVRSRKLLILK
jgi:hypothetical protein